MPVLELTTRELELVKEALQGSVAANHHMATIAQRHGIPTTDFEHRMRNYVQLLKLTEHAASLPDYSDSSSYSSDQHKNRSLNPDGTARSD